MQNLSPVVSGLIAGAVAGAVVGFIGGFLEGFPFWDWLKKNHPVINEVVWWLIILMCVATLLN